LPEIKTEKISKGVFSLVSLVKILRVDCQNQQKVKVKKLFHAFYYSNQFCRMNFTLIYNFLRFPQKLKA
jgi:hypothetical protein